MIVVEKESESDTHQCLRVPAQRILQKIRELPKVPSQNHYRNDV